MDFVSTVIADIATILIGSGFLATLRLDRTRYNQRISSDWKAREFLSFRGQHFKYLKKRQVVDLLRESAINSKVHFYTNDQFPSEFPNNFEGTIDVQNDGKQTKLYVRCLVESYGKFFQVRYEWSADQDAMKSYTSPEFKAMQNFVEKAERILSQADLIKSQSEYKLVGARVLTTQKFAPEIIRYVLANAISIVDERGITTSFKASLEARQNPWADLVEAFVNIENGNGFFIRFLSLDQSANGIEAWELRCDWKGSLSATWDTASPEWEIARALFASVESQLSKAGATPCFPSKKYMHVQSLGIYEAWEYQAIEKIARELSYALTNEGIVLEQKDFKFRFFASPVKKKYVPGAAELRLSYWGTEDRGISVFAIDVFFKLSLLDICIQFRPLPPKCGEVLIAWTGRDDERRTAKLTSNQVIEVLLARTISKLVRADAHCTAGIKYQEVQFLTESDDDAAIAVKGFWPTAQDYNESVQLPEICFADRDLRSASTMLNTLGLPRASSGAFACVYKVSAGDRHWALRCFNAPVKDQLLRYEKISQFVCADDLPYTVYCEFLEQGIKVVSKWYPAVKMEWVEGTPLNSFIGEILDDSDALTDLRKKFGIMMKDLQTSGIAHGDLQHGNIIIRDREFVLVDYDNMYVPELANFVSWENGHRNYQHPRRDSSHFGQYLDNFSAWVIDTALLTLVHVPELWDRFGAGDENLLFTSADFSNPDDSELIQLLLNHKNPVLSQRANFILWLLRTEVSQIPYLDAEFS